MKTSIEEVSNLSMRKFNELMGLLINHEILMNKFEEKATDKREKPITLKAGDRINKAIVLKVTNSDNNTDDEMTLFTRNIKKY